MKLLIELSKKRTDIINQADGIILPLKGFSVESILGYSIDEIKEICNSYKGEIFIKMNKNFMNEEIPSVREVLLTLNELPIKAIFFYDLAILQLKKELNIKVDLVWNQTHMVNNYRTCDYYYSKGVKYALLSKEITLEEIIEIITKSSITSMVEIVSKPSVAFSKRKLISNYYQDIKKRPRKNLTILEKVSSDNYKLIENEDGTTFYLNKITNGTVYLKTLYDNNCQYIIMREYGLEDYFSELVYDTKEYLQKKCVDNSYVEKYKILGNNTNFFQRKTIYRVKNV